MRALKAFLKVMLGLSLGLGVAELVFRWRDSGAFPHVNFYVPDETLGVRLAPHAHMQLRIGKNNPITTLETNGSGFRGAEWPAPSEGEVLVVGDSQVFGLGVEANETFSAKLAEELKAPVLNAGVPTYGPAEYTAVVRAELRRKTVKTVVYVLNLSNDLFELERPNAARHRVWDGWAVRAETSPGSVTDFPFRRQLMTRSHLVFALRQFLYTNDSNAEGFATEGTWKDVAQAGAGVTPLPPEDEGARKLLAARGELNDQLHLVAEALEQHLEQKLRSEKYVDELKPFVPKGGDPRDILFSEFAESARRTDITAYHLFVASIGQARNQKALDAIAAKYKDPKLKKLLDERAELRAKLDALRPEGEAPHVEPLDVLLRETKKACDEAGARLVVVALPLDVMVSHDEWKKYPSATPIDLTATKVLTEDLVARAERVGALGVDPTEALRAAEPGAFLDGDLHLTPKGHAALAKELAAALRRPPKPKSALQLPEGRTWPPSDDEFLRVDECSVKGSTAAGCDTKLVNEWLRVECVERTTPDERRETLDGLEVLEGGHGDAFVFQGEEGEVLMVPVLRGDVMRARFTWDSVEQTLTAQWPADGGLTMAFDAVKKRGKEIPRRRSYDTLGDPLNPGSCDEGQGRRGATLRCASACPCTVGHCEPWPSGAFCAVP